MEEIEFDVLDELYFVTSYEELSSNLSYPDEVISNCLNSLFNKEWIRVYSDGENEIIDEDVDIKNNYSKYYFLASKKGLFAHNSR